MDATLLFHFVMCSMIGACLLGCGIAAIVECYTAADARFARRRKQRAKRRAKESKARREYREHFDREMEKALKW